MAGGSTRATTTVEMSEDEATELVANLVSIDSQNPPGREREFVHETLRRGAWTPSWSTNRSRTDRR